MHVSNPLHSVYLEMWQASARGLCACLRVFLHNWRRSGLLACALLLCGCAVQPEPVMDPSHASPIEALDEADIPSYTEEFPQARADYAKTLTPASQAMTSWRQMAPALAASRAYAALRPQSDIAVSHGDVTVLWSDIVRTLDRLTELLPRLDAEPELFAERFRWLRLTQGADFSGYYEPVIKASLKRQGVFQHPLYRIPPDLKTLDLGVFESRFIGQRIVYRTEGGQAVPYYSRAAIDGKGVLRERGLELAYVENSVDAYFLQVQGSGRLELTDGSMRHILYAAKNGRSYVGIGRWLRDRGLLKEAVSMKSVRDWLAAHPEQMRTVMDLNESYVFFRFAEQGPIGSMGQTLTPWVSLAVDRALLPLGAAVAFSVQAPFPGGQIRELRGLGLAQDTGSAVKRHQIDLFCGAGEAAAYTAGYLNTSGTAWLLLARD